ncbi:FecCD family ABC transporter permease [Frigidibacter sp. MR17.24]|uniref:FecCD family ABC transporter permease n=1 Tax=Frigidibacter sp. MR17.24 TaxID=3127345 RepID=UPI003012CD01
MRTAAILLVLVATAVASLSLGLRNAGPAALWHALAAPEPATALDITLREIRLPRLLAGLLAGAALGMAGTVMQALTRNPLADPGLLGIGAGAALAIVLGALATGRADGGAMAMMAFPGAAAGAAAVFALGGGFRGEMGPVRLTLAGAALNAFLLSLVTAIALLRGDALDIWRNWVSGSLAAAATRPLAAMAPIAAAGAVLALVIAPMLETLALGQALSRGLGARLLQTQGLALLAVTLMTGAAVAVAGPLAFLGLVTPLLARRVMGQSLRGQLVGAALLGATILVAADLAGRLVVPPAEIRAGVMVALIGAPVFLWIARRLAPGAGT